MTLLVPLAWECCHAFATAVSSEFKAYFALHGLIQAGHGAFAVLLLVPGPFVYCSFCCRPAGEVLYCSLLNLDTWIEHALQYAVSSYSALLPYQFPETPA